jgi:hypothetical protein
MSWTGLRRGQEATSGRRNPWRLLACPLVETWVVGEFRSDSDSGGTNRGRRLAGAGVQCGRRRLERAAIRFAARRLLIVCGIGGDVRA